MLEQGRKTPGLVAFLSEGKRHLEEEVKVAEGTEKVREAKNLLNEVAAVGRTAKKVFEGARSIISETFWTTGSVTLNLLVTNPVGSGERTLSVKASLPEGITAAHVLELPADLTVEQDSSGDFSFVTGAVSLPEGESRKVKVNLEDIWQIPEKELENLESTTQQYYQTPLGTNFSSQALVLKDNILKNLEELVLKQINAITPEEKVAAHKRNLQILETARKDLKELEALVKQYRRTQTLRIAMMVGAALLLGLLFFLFWRRLGSAVEGVAAKSEALSMASHQLRSPLTALQWILETLKRKLGNKLSAEEKEFLEKAYGSSTRMMGMISDFLSASKLEVGKLIVESKPTDLKEIAKSVLEELQPTISSRKLAVEEEYAKDLSVIQSDPQLIRVIFQNLLTNAVRYTKKGKIRLEVSRREGVVKIVVTDTGCGIPLNQQAKIFTKLFRADNARELEREGTGLGLYLVKRVVERLGGKIGFTSEENRGTTFNVRLPA
jgi:signal transduction histidine kinase